MRVLKFGTLLFSLVALVVLGIIVRRAAVNTPTSPWYIARWRELDTGFSRLEYITPDKVAMVVYRLDPELYKFDLKYQVPPQTVAAWAEQIPEAEVIVNGVYFLDDFSPAGQMIVDGQDLSQRMFDITKAGAVTFEPVFGISEIIDPHWQELGLQDGAQTYPFLLKNGQPAIKEDSGLLARRTFIGTDIDGQIYLGVVWKNNVSLHALMGYLLDLDVQWGHVINLDGGTSTGVAVSAPRFSETLNSAPVPNVIVVKHQNQ